MTDRKCFCAVLALLVLVMPAAACADADLEQRIAAAVSDPGTLALAGATWDAGEREEHFAGQRAPGTDAPPDADTAFAIGSITKAFTNLLLAEKVAAGKVRYDTTLQELLGDEVAFANPAVGRITLQALATHTGGLPRLPGNLDVSADPADPYAAYDAEALMQGLAQAREAQRIGDHYAYSNFGLGLLGWLLGREAGDGYPAALRREVLEPLGLEHTGFDPGDNAAPAWADGKAVDAWSFDALAGAGALWSTVDDLLRLAEVLLGARPNPLDHELSADFEWLAEAGAFGVTRVWHVAETAAGPVYWHSGGTAGHRAFFGVRPATSQALVLLVAGRADPTPMGLDWFGFEAGEPDEATVDTALFGQYEPEVGQGIGVFERQGRLMAQVSGQVAQPLSPVGGDWYSLDVIDAGVRFVREDGEVVGLEIVQQGRTQRADRVAERAEVMDRQEVELDDEALDDYVGEYALNPQFVFTIRRGGDSGLEARLTGQPFLPVYPRGDDVFFYKAVDAELHFERADDGSVDALVLHQGGLRQRAERVEP